MRNAKILLIGLSLFLAVKVSSLSQESIEYLNNAPDEVVQMMRNALIAESERDIYKKSYTDTLNLLDKQVILTEKISKEFKSIKIENHFLWIGIAVTGVISIGELIFLIIQK